MKPVGLLVAEIDQGIVLDPGEVGPDLGRHVVVEVRWGNGDHLQVHSLAIHVGQPDGGFEDGLGKRPEALSARVPEIPPALVLDQFRTMVRMGRRHPGESFGDDGVSVDVDRGQRRRGSIAIGTNPTLSGRRDLRDHQHPNMLRLVEQNRRTGPVLLARLRSSRTWGSPTLSPSRTGRVWYLHRALLDSPEIDVYSPTREGEGIALAAGLWVGGRKPLVILQNTGPMEAGDAVVWLRDRTQHPTAPPRRVAGLPGVMAGTVPVIRPYPYTEPLLKAWELPHDV